MSKKKGVNEDYIKDKIKKYEEDLAHWQEQMGIARENVSRLTGAIISLKELLGGEVEQKEKGKK